MTYLLRIFWITGILAGCASNPQSPSDAGSGSSDGGIDAGQGNGDGGIDAGSDAGVDAGHDYDVPFTSGTSTVAGGPGAGWVDGPRKDAQFANPVNVAYRDHRLYVADFDGGKIRVIDLVTYETSTLISQTNFQRPFALAFGADDTLYASTDNDENGTHSLMTGTIWRIPPGAHSAAVVASGIGRPRGLAVLPDGRLAVSDYVHHVVELADPATGNVSLLAGAWDTPGTTDATGADARFAIPYGLAVRSDGALVIADYGNHRIRLLTLDGITTTIAGSAPGFADGEPSAALFRHPQAVAIAANGDIYVTDSDNFRVRLIAGTTVTTIAGDGTGSYRDDDDPLQSQLYGLEGLAVVADGSMVYVADGSRGTDLPFNRIRQIARH